MAFCSLLSIQAKGTAKVAYFGAFTSVGTRCPCVSSAFLLLAYGWVKRLVHASGLMNAPDSAWQAGTVAQKIADDPKNVAVIGHMCSGTTLAGSPIINKVNLANPNTCVDCPGTAGRITNIFQLATQRQWQFGLRLEF